MKNNIMKKLLAMVLSFALFFQMGIPVAFAQEGNGSSI